MRARVACGLRLVADLLDPPAVVVPVVVPISGERRSVFMQNVARLADLDARMFTFEEGWVLSAVALAIELELQVRAQEFADAERRLAEGTWS
jgi:hypothetical protein